MHNKLILWYLAIIKACPQLVLVEICNGTSLLLEEIATAVQLATSTLRTVIFCGTLWRNDLWRVEETSMTTTARIDELLSKPSFHKVTTVKLLNLDYSSEVEINHPIHSLHVENTGTGHQRLSNLRFNHLSNLHSLHLIGDTSYFEDIPEFVLSLGSSLRHYSFVPDVPDHSLHQYARLFHFGPDLAMFRSLVNLTSIKINNSRGCSHTVPA